jgi:sec-independent protein translocase protein TatA
MGGLSIWHWIIVLVIVMVLFGRGRISEIMGDFGKGIKSFKEGVSEGSGDHHAATPPPAPAQIASPAPIAAPTPVVSATTVQPPVTPVETIVDPTTGQPVPEPGMMHIQTETKTGA